MPDPQISVLLATCNQAATLPDALASLRAQTLAAEHWELIVVNDGSTDPTAEILSRHAGWAQVIHQENRGLAASCNAGLERARGEYLARIDSDDLASPQWLEKIRVALEGVPDASCAVPDRYERDRTGQRQVRVDPGNLYSLIACGTLFRTELLRRIGGYRPCYWEEYDLYLRLRPLGRFLHVPDPLYIYRRHAASMTHSKEARLAGWRQLLGRWGEETLRAAGAHPDLEEVLR